MTSAHRADSTHKISYIKDNVHDCYDYMCKTFNNRPELPAALRGPKDGALKFLTSTTNAKRKLSEIADEFLIGGSNTLMSKFYPNIGEDMQIRSLAANLYDVMSYIWLCKQHHDLVTLKSTLRDAIFIPPPPPPLAILIANDEWSEHDLDQVMTETTETEDME